MGTRGASVSERFQEVVQTVAAHLCISALFSLLTLLLSTAVSLGFMRSVLLCGALRLLLALGEGLIGGFFSGGRIIAAHGNQSVLAPPGTPVFVVVDGAWAR